MGSSFPSGGVEPTAGMILPRRPGGRPQRVRPRPGVPSSYFFWLFGTYTAVVATVSPPAASAHVTAIV